jgi:hypothetical protein
MPSNAMQEVLTSAVGRMEWMSGQVVFFISYVRRMCATALRVSEQQRAELARTMKKCWLSVQLE